MFYIKNYSLCVMENFEFLYAIHIQTVAEVHDLVKIVKPSEHNNNKGK